MNPLQNHPFPVLATFERVVALSFAFPAASLAPLVPPGLELDVYESYGFVTVALVWTRDLRPAGFPRILGQDFFLAGYRVFAILRDETGRRLRGLKILRSETDKRRMVFLGNLMTAYNYRPVHLEISDGASGTRVATTAAGGKPGLDILFDSTAKNPELPPGSPFPDWRTARRFAGPMPFTFSPAADGRFVVIEGSRSSWTPRPIHVKSWEVPFFDEPPLQDVVPVLANAFTVENVSYRWSKGRIVRPGGAR